MLANRIARIRYLFRKISVFGCFIYVVIKPEFSKFPKKIKVRSLSSSRCKFSISVDFVSRKKNRQKVFMSFIEDLTAEFTSHDVH